MNDLPVYSFHYGDVQVDAYQHAYDTYRLKLTSFNARHADIIVTLTEEGSEKYTVETSATEPFELLMVDLFLNWLAAESFSTIF